MPQFSPVKTILNKKKQRDAWFLDEYTVNAYSGCSFNCVYCYIRGSRYGEHMQDKLVIRENAVVLLEKELARRAAKNAYGFIVLSSATDPYLHFEQEQQITRRMLEVILHYRFPVHVITKSDLVTRDIDLLQQINEQSILPVDLRDKLSSKTLVSFSFSTIDDDIATIFEPGAPPPSARLEAMKVILDKGLHCGVSLMPLLPYITDTGEHLEEMFSLFAATGVRYVLGASLTLFGYGNADSRTLVLRAVQKHYPLLVEKYDRFFSAGSDSMPAFYRSALQQKIAALCLQHHLKSTIL